MTAATKLKEVRERPILFSAPMVRAILEGRKTQTRRVVRPTVYVAYGDDLDDPDYIVDQHDPEFGAACVECVPCPYGVPGDQLWVKETFATTNPKWRGGTRSKQPFVNYRASDEIGPYLKWRPSIFMPRWASRIMLPITSVRVERLQDISEEDAKAEGLQWAPDELGGETYGLNDVTGSWQPSARSAFRVLWESINGEGSWDANPWAWVLGWDKAEVRP